MSNDRPYTPSQDYSTSWQEPEQSISPWAPPEEETGQCVDPALASYSPTTSVATGTKSCGDSGDKPTTPKQNEVLCDLNSLKLHVFDGVENEVIDLLATRNMRGDKVAPAVPKRLHNNLSRYDLVVEVLAPEASRLGFAPGGAFEMPKKPAGKSGRVAGWDNEAPAAEHTGNSIMSSVADWSARCGSKPHNELVLLWKDHGGGNTRVGAGATIKKEVFTRPLLPSTFDPIEFVQRLWDPTKLCASYELHAASCGRPGQGPGREDLKALVVTYPVAKSGIVFELAPKPFVFGWDAGEADKRAKDKQDAYEKQKAEHDAKKAALEDVAAGKGAGDPGIKPGDGRKARKRWKQQQKKAQAARDRAKAELGQLTAPDAPVIGFIDKAKFGFGRHEEKSFDWGIVIGDRVLGWDEMKELGGKEGAVASVMQIIDAAQTFSQGVSSVFTFLTAYSPALVQPKIAFELSFLTLEGFIGMKFRPHLSDTRLRSVTRSWLIEVEGTLIDAAGTIAIIVGKRAFGSGLDITAAVTLSGNIAVEEKVHFDEVKVGSGEFWNSIWAELRKNLKAKGYLQAVGKIEGRATLVGQDIGAIGGDVKAAIGIEVVLDEQKPAYKVKTVTPPVVMRYWVRSDLVKEDEDVPEAVAGQIPPGGKPQKWILTEGGASESEHPLPWA